MDWYLSEKINLTVLAKNIEDIILQMDRLFDNKYRFCIMAFLIKKEKNNYSSLKKLLQLSDGALAYHLNYLKNANYINEEKKFIDRKPVTSYFLTELGEKSFTEYKIALTRILII